MPTIITVHGTFSSGPETGNKWWQRDSSFHQQLAERFSSAGARPTFEPFQWDGKNSETSRREAGIQLAKKLKDMQEPVVLVGHSHGGSVIEHALLYANQKKFNLDHILRIITVGTPFFSFQPSRFLFSKLGNAGKSYYLSTMLMVVILVTSLIAILRSESIHAFSKINNTAGGVSGLLVLFIVYLIVRHYYRAKTGYISKRRIKAIKEKYADRFFPLHHPDDEAILGLSATANHRLRVFHSDFFDPFLTIMTLFAPILLLFFIALSPALTEIAYDIISGIFSAFGVHYQSFDNLKNVSLNSGIDGSENQDMIWNLYVLGVALGTPFARIVSYAVVPQVDAIGFVISTPLVVLLTGSFYYLVSRVFIFVLSFFLKPLSKQIARISNKLTSKQLLDTAWGNDVSGSHGKKVKTSPGCHDGAGLTLPTELADEILTYSNTEMARSVPEIRQAISHGFSALEKEKEMTGLWDFFKGDELVHTAYFKIPHFNQFIAELIAKTPGFADIKTIQQAAAASQTTNWATLIHRQQKSLHANAHK